MPDSQREAARRVFLREAGCAAGQLTPLTPDASFRRYYRVRDGERVCMLMDAPPPREALSTFIRVARHLDGLGLRVPAVYSFDLGAGFALVEDLGDQTFTRLLADGADESRLYHQAVDLLAALQNHRAATKVDVPRYDNELLVEEVLRMIDWYYPGVRRARASGQLREEFAHLWHTLLASLPPLAPVLVLRDFHVDNLMRVRTADGRSVCALLDFQDAVVGSPAYDLMSLLEDARRRVPPELAAEIRTYYHGAVDTPDVQAFELHYHALAAQRHCKVLGNFTRLCRRDGKCTYLTHLPHVVEMLQSHLDAPLLQPLRRWLDEYLPMRHTAQVSAR